MAYDDDVLASYLTAPEEHRDGIAERLTRMKPKTELQAALKLHACATRPYVSRYPLAEAVREAAEDEIERLTA